MKKINLFTRCLTQSIVVASLALAGNQAFAGDADKGKELSATCAGCHGVDGNSTVPTNPILAGQYESYIIRALTDYKSGARNNPIMAGFAAGLSKQDMKDLAAYFASQESTLSVPD